MKRLATAGPSHSSEIGAEMKEEEEEKEGVEEGSGWERRALLAGLLSKWLILIDKYRRARLFVIYVDVVRSRVINFSSPIAG